MVDNNRLAPATDAGGRQLALFVFIDALGWRLYQQHDFLGGELRTAAPLQTVLGYSCSCDPTIISGRLPQEHGHFSFFRFDPQRSPFGLCRWLRWLPRRITDRGRVRRLLSRTIAWWHGYTGYFQIYNVPLDKLPVMDYSEKRDIYQPGGLVGGTPTIFDHLRQHQIPFSLSDWRRSERHNLETMAAELHSGVPRLAYLYLAGLDGVLHAEGTQSPRVAEKLRWYDRQLRDLLAVARAHYDQVRVYVFSDHGMTDVVGCCDLMSEIERLGLQYGSDYAAVYDSTMARFWLLNDNADRKIRGALERQSRWGRVLQRSELAEFGCLFDDARYGDLFFLLHPGQLLCPSYMGLRPIRGMHGYDPAHEDSTALLASTEPLAETPARLDGLYDVMLGEASRCQASPAQPTQAGLAPTTQAEAGGAAADHVMEAAG